MHSDPTTPFHNQAVPIDGSEIIALCGMAVGLVAIIAITITIVTIVMALYYRRTQLDEMEATLKIEMIQRGMSADDIVRVLKAHMDKRDTKAAVQRFRERTAAHSAAAPG